MEKEVSSLVSAAATSVPTVGHDGGVHALAMFAFDIGMVFAPTIGYISQAFEINNTKNAEGFAVHVSLILLCSNSLRIMYRAGEAYAVPLFFQALIMVVAQLYLVVAVLKVKMMDSLIPNASPSSLERKATISNIDVNHAPSFLVQITRYLLGNEHQGDGQLHTPRMFLQRYFTLVVITFTACLVLLAAIPGFARVLGFMALGVEATLLIPQILLNHHRRSTEGITRLLLLTWVGGDVIKMIYFTVAHQPLPFLICGSLQLLCDIIILHQVFTYECLMGNSADAAVSAE